jgi:uncharacterized protein (DUF736 family)
MIIGKFTKDDEGYSGNVNCLALHVFGLVFKPVPMKQGSGPDFVVVAETQDGEEYEIGGAWNRVSEKKGRAYLSVRLDGPTLAAPINCALMRNPDGAYQLVWNRAKPKADGEPTAEETAA